MAFHKMPPVNMIRQMLMYREWVPHRVRFWLFIFFALIYQLVGGVYLASMTQMVGDLAFLSEDVTMAGYCTLIGLTIIFPMLFRIKFRFFTRQLFFITGIGLILCNIVTMYVEIPWVIWIVCFFAGILKMAGMFGCMSSIQLCITPTRNFGVFFPVVYILVCGAIQLSGMCTAYIAYFTNWRVMNLLLIVLLIIHMTIAFFFMKKDHRSGPYLPLKGVDFFGFALWSALLIVGTWIFTFGEHYAWWENQTIWIATLIFIILLIACLAESKFKENPYIALKAFTYPRVISLMIILLGLSVLQAAAHSLQPIYVNSVLQFDSLNAISLNYPELLGVIFGALLAFYSIVKWKWSVKKYIFMAFALIAYYEISMYFLIGYDTNKEAMYLPLFAFGMAEVMMETIATYYLSQAIPFLHFFMTISIIGFIRAGLGTAIGAAIVHRLFNWSMAKNFMLSSSNIDGQATIANVHNWADQMNIISTQSLMISIKECYGYLILIAIIFMVIVLATNFKTSITRMLPRLMSVRRWLNNTTSQDPTT